MKIFTQNAYNAEKLYKHLKHCLMKNSKNEFYSSTSHRVAAVVWLKNIGELYTVKVMNELNNNIYLKYLCNNINMSSHYMFMTASVQYVLG